MRSKIPLLRFGTGRDGAIESSDAHTELRRYRPPTGSLTTECRNRRSIDTPLGAYAPGACIPSSLQFIRRGWAAYLRLPEGLLGGVG